MNFIHTEAKYIDENGAAIEIPCEAYESGREARAPDLAIKTFQALACEGMSRVDFFLKKDGTVHL